MTLRVTTKNENSQRAAPRTFNNLRLFSKEVALMTLINVVLVLIVVGVLLWLIDRFIPMAGPIKSILNAVVVIAVVVWLLNVFGLWGYITNLRVPTHH